MSMNFNTSEDQHLSPAILATRTVEREIVADTVKTLLDRGYSLSVNDGEETVVDRSKDAGEITHAMFTTDSDTLTAHGEDGQRVGGVEFIYGNGGGGYEVISDYSMALETEMQAVIDRSETRLDAEEHEQGGKQIESYAERVARQAVEREDELDYEQTLTNYDVRSDDMELANPHIDYEANHREWRASVEAVRLAEAAEQGVAEAEGMDVSSFMAKYVGGSGNWASEAAVAEIVVKGEGEVVAGNSTYRVEGGDLHWSNTFGQSASVKASDVLEYLEWSNKEVVAQGFTVESTTTAKTEAATAYVPMDRKRSTLQDRAAQREARSATIAEVATSTDKDSQRLTAGM